MVEPKLSSALTLKYKDGTYTDTLRGNNILLSTAMNRNGIEISLTDMLQSWNKTLLSYADANEFISKCAELESLALHDSAVVAAIGAISNSNWRMDINCGAKGVFEYTGHAKVEEGSVSFIVKGFTGILDTNKDKAHQR